MLGLLCQVCVFLLFGLPLLSVALLIIQKRRSMKWWLIGFGLCSLGCYVFLFLSVLFEGQLLERELHRLDLNKDGIFSGPELTPEARAAMKDLASDTARSYAPITGLITAPLYSGFWHTIVGLPYLLIMNRRSKDRETPL